MRYWMLGTVALVMLLVGLGEPVVIIGFLALPFIGWRTDSLALRIGSLLVAVAGLFLHSLGYKLYGSPQIVTTPRLEGAITVVGIAPPDRVLFADGRTTVLEGLYFPQEVDLRGPNEQNFMLWHLLNNRSPKASLEVRLHEGRGEYLRRNLYWCGNTFFPSMLPRRLPSHTAVDFGSLLVQAALALPRGESGDEAYKKHLLEAFERSTSSSSHYPELGLVKRHDEAAVALGNSLIDPKSVHFVAGAYVLIAAQCTEAYPGIEREIRRRQQRNRDDYDAVAQSRSSDFDTLLAWVDVDEARQQMPAASRPTVIPHRDADCGFAWGTYAATLASHGELSGFDRAVQIMSDGHAPDSDRRAISSAIPFYFKWPAESPLFLTWYVAVRPKLRSGRDEFGRLAFWLDDGKPFDDAYVRSIEQVAPKK